MTQNAVAQWQEKNNVVSGGDAGSTGLGVVGPRTRATSKSCRIIGSEPCGDAISPLYNRLRQNVRAAGSQSQMRAGAPHTTNASSRFRPLPRLQAPRRPPPRLHVLSCNNPSVLERSRRSRRMPTAASLGTSAFCNVIEARTVIPRAALRLFFERASRAHVKEKDASRRGQAPRREPPV